MSDASDSPAPPTGPTPEEEGLPSLTPDLLEQEHGEDMDNVVPTDGYATLPVVGLGGSAGGLSALQAFFANVPLDSGMAYVVVMHLSPGHESHLAELLGRSTRLPVQQVRGRTKVEPDHVYVIPPGKLLSMTDGSLILSEINRLSGKHVAVDLFFRTLADAHGPHSAAVILSGADGDGAIGLKRIKERGGLAVVQDPAEAEYDGMPRSSLATGLVDWVLPAAQMPARLVEYWRTEKRLPPSLVPAGLAADGQPPTETVPARSEDDGTLHDILSVLRVRTGHDFTYYKRATVLRRIARRMQVHNVAEPAAYLALLRVNHEEPQNLLKDLLISVTNFFRDREAFKALETVIPALFHGKTPADTVRVWVPACATGEEAYSVAMLLREHAERLERPPGVQVFATDLDADAVQTGRDGVYPETIVSDVSQERLRRFFNKEHGGYRVRSESREIVLFALHDLLRDPPFSRLDLVSCRNLLIYLNRDAQAHALEIFHFSLRPEGTLFLGTSESVDEENTLFTVLDKKRRLFVRRPGARIAPRVISGTTTLTRFLQQAQLADSGREPAPARIPEYTAATRPGAPVGTANADGLPFDWASVHYEMLEEVGPPSVLVDSDYRLVHASAQAGRFLQIGGGGATHDFLRIAHPLLRTELRALLYRATQTGVMATTADVPFESGDGTRTRVTLHATLSRAAESSLLLVVFQERPETPAGASPADGERPAGSSFEQQLTQARKQLRDTVEWSEAAGEELKASNEELQAINEELRSATEELETGREELQSTNEELNTVNQELKSKVEELAQSNGDLQNLMNATQIATIFLDRGLCIDRYTPSAVTIFNLIPTDLGRPLSDLTTRLNYPNLAADAQRVLDDLGVAELEVPHTDGRYFLARMRPYRTVDDRIAGIVLTFVDITARKRAEDALLQSEAQLRSLVSASANTEYKMSADWKEMRFLEGKEFLATTPDPSRSWLEMYIPPEDRPPVLAAIEKAIRDKSTFDLEHRVLRPDGTVGWTLSRAVPLLDARGEIVEWFGVASDTTERRRAVEALRESEERFRAVANLVPDLLYRTDPQGRMVWCNQQWTDYTGKTLAEAQGYGWMDCVAPEDRARVRQEYQDAIEDGKKFHSEHRLVGRDGQARWFLARAEPFRDAGGQIAQWFGAKTNVEDYKRASTELAQSEGRLQLLLENAREFAIFSTDLESRVTTWNTGAELVLGYTRAEVLGLSAKIIFTSEDRVAGAAETEIRTALAEGRAADERWHQRRDGTRFWASGVLMRMTDAQGQAVGFVKILRDQTEARQTREQLERSREELLVALRETEQARLEVEAAGKAKDHFLAVLSHELRTPLTPVIMGVMMLKRRRELSEIVRETVAMIEHNVQIEAHLIDDLLDLTRVSRGKLEIVREPMDLHDAVRQAAEISAEDIRQKQQAFTLALDAGEHRVQGDLRRLQQVFWNLLKNASKFTPQGGAIRLGTRNAPGRVVVEVVDTGIGFDAGAAARIFEAFTQASQEVTRQFGGLGLGLAIAKAAVEAHDGTLSARSDGPGRGATFTVELPLTADGNDAKLTRR